jgi:hypothetical protein
MITERKLGSLQNNIIIPHMDANKASTGLKKAVSAL